MSNDTDNFVDEEWVMDNAEHCRSCNAEVLWLESSSTHKKVPIDAHPSPNGNISVNMEARTYTVVSAPGRAGRSDLHTNHFATCPQATVWKHAKGR